jgi:lactoylglutathione lyase
MTLNHVNLTVSDVAGARGFLERYFGLQGSTDPYTGAALPDRGNAGLAILFDDRGLVLTLMKGKGEVSYPSTFHIGFMQENEEHVNELYERLREDGFDVDPPQRSHAWSFYLRAPGGFTVEVLC